jgi:hypothetical protein
MTTGVNGQSAPHEGNDLVAEVLTYFAALLGWGAVFWGAEQLWGRPLGYLAGVATLLACIVPASTNRMRDAVAAAAIGAIAFLANAVVVVVI